MQDRKKLGECVQNNVLFLEAKELDTLEENLLFSNKSSIIDYLQEQKQITDLVIRGSADADARQIFLQLSNFLLLLANNSASITSLEMSKVIPPSDSVSRLAISRNQQLTKLSLTHCYMGNVGAEMLANHPHLTELSLINCHVGDAGAKALGCNRKLSILNLRDNKDITNAGGRGLLLSRTLVYLDVQGTTIEQPIKDQLSAQCQLNRYYQDRVHAAEVKREYVPQDDLKNVIPEKRWAKSYHDLWNLHAQGDTLDAQQLAGAKALLNNYTGNNSRWQRFWGGAWNRSYLREVTAILNDTSIDTFDKLLVALDKIPNKNPIGSLQNIVDLMIIKTYNAQFPAAVPQPAVARPS